ncbi:MAG: non-hydrolyzing UDP-N-acetylglucosamine 2-epimerase [Alphaproteobacteria bacterium]
MPSICVVAGTRPEIIKLAPVCRALRWRFPGAVTWIATGQHGSLAAQALGEFGLRPDVRLQLTRDASRVSDILPASATPRQRGSLAGVLAELIERLDDEFARGAYDLVVVQGDTTSTLAATLAAFTRKIPVAHVEAGLRSFDLDHPFPEEAWRAIVAQIASLHFAPTQRAAKNLAAVGARRDKIFVTGNTVVDALHWILEKPASTRVEKIACGPQRLALVTLHRRENWQGPLEEVCDALRGLADSIPDIGVCFVTHANPKLRKTIDGRLGKHERIALIEPLGYSDFIQLLKQSTIVLTDSGGIQEEAPPLGVPVLILRETTERIEAVDAGVAKLVGTDPARIVKETTRLLTNGRAYRAMTRRISLFGDGHASERIAEIIIRRLMRHDAHLAA